jgi:hypothetical protein
MHKKDTDTHTHTHKYITIFISREINSVSQEFDAHCDDYKREKMVICCHFSSQYEDFPPASRHILPLILKNIHQVKNGCNAQYGRTGAAREEIHDNEL